MFGATTFSETPFAAVVPESILWAVISTAQTPGWASVLPTVTTGGGAGLSGGAFSASPMSSGEWQYDPVSSVWSTVSTSQTPGWASVLPTVTTGGGAGLSGGAFAASPMSSGEWQYDPTDSGWTAVSADTTTTWTKVDTVN